MKRDGSIGVWRTVQSVYDGLRIVFLNKKRRVSRLVVGKIDGVCGNGKGFTITNKYVILKEENGYE